MLFGSLSGPSGQNWSFPLVWSPKVLMMDGPTLLASTWALDAYPLFKVILDQYQD